MKYICFLFLSVIVSITASAQDSVSSGTSKDTIFTSVEVESEFPGGNPAWAKFLQNNLNYPGKAVRKKVEGIVVVQFIVDAAGKVSDIEAISGPELLRPAAIDVISKSPRWIPANDNGKKVKSYKKQPIAFRLR